MTDQFNSQIATAEDGPDGIIRIDIPYPAVNLYDGCTNVETFVPKASLSNPKSIHKIHAKIVEQNPELASTHSFKLAAKDTSVEILVRPRPVASADSMASAAPSDRFSDFPSQDKLNASLAKATESLDKQKAKKADNPQDKIHGYVPAIVESVPKCSARLIQTWAREKGLSVQILDRNPNPGKDTNPNLVYFRIFAAHKAGYVEKKQGSAKHATKRGGSA